MRYLVTSGATVLRHGNTSRQSIPLQAKPGEVAWIVHGTGPIDDRTMTVVDGVLVGSDLTLEAV